MKPATQFTSIGGQAVIEGVMMRAPRFIAVAVRKPDSRIVIRNQPYLSLARRFSWFRKPVFRGVVMLFESMYQGIHALSYSANVASEGQEDGEELSSWAIALSIASALALGLGLFVALPHLLTALATSKDVTGNSPWFHLIDGVFKMAILLAYVYLISWMKDIHRVFQYHGAEHKAIYAFEAGEELTVENARKYSTHHPRCGTSFLLFLVVISILVFSAIFPIFNLGKFSEAAIINHALMIVVKIVLMLPIAGLAYEFIKMSASRQNNPIFRMLVWPGMILQQLTTREPDDHQLEVALASLRQVLKLEKAEQGSPQQEEIEIAHLAELAIVQAQVTEFPEH